MATSDVVAVLAGAELDDNHDQEACPRCGRPADEICFSNAVGARCCADCHSRAATRTPQERAQTRAAIRRHQTARRHYKPPKSPDPPPGSYAWLVSETCRRIEERTGMRVSHGLDGTGRAGAYCPVGCGGLVVVQFLDSPPRLRFSSGSFTGDEPDRCSQGCSAAQIDEALGW
jgi:hypothetical protein